MNETEREKLTALGLTEAAVLPGPQPEERRDALETTTEDMILLLAELIGGR